MASAAEVAILLRLRGGRQVQSEFKSTARAMRQVNPVVSQMGKHFGLTNRAITNIDGRMKSFRRNVVGMGKAMLATAGVFAAWNGLKSMVNTTEEFSRQVIRMTKATRLSAEESSRWVAIMKIRGIDATSFSRGLTIMSTKLRDAQNGGKSSIQTFNQLGLNWRSLMSLPLEERLFKITDALNSQGDAGNRLALGQRVFGRGFQKLLPILSKGSDGIKEQLALADKYGVTLHGKTIKSMKEFIEAQHENELAMLGMQITLSQSVIPTITNVTRGLNKFVLEMKDGTGRGGQFADALRDFWSVLGPISKHIARHIGTYAKFVAVIWLMVKAFKAARSAAIAFGVAEDAAILGPIGLTAAAIVGLIAVLYLLDRRFHWFGKTIDFVHHHWKALLMLFPVFGPALIGFIAIAKKLVHPFQQAYHWTMKLVHAIGKVHMPGGGAFALAGKIGNFATHPFGRANGGTEMSARQTKVGEFGPEIVTLPAGSSVSPASRSRGGELVTAPINVIVDGKVLATTTARVVADRKARS
jgi:hypothetical protein